MITVAENITAVLFFVSSILKFLQLFEGSLQKSSKQLWVMIVAFCSSFLLKRCYNYYNMSLPKTLVLGRGLCLLLKSVKITPNNNFNVTEFACSVSGLGMGIL